MPFQPTNRTVGAQPQQEEQVSIWNQSYRAGTPLSVLGTIYVTPEPGKAFPVLKRHARNLMSKHGKGGRLTAAAVPSARAAYTPPPGYRLVKIEDEVPAVEEVEEEPIIEEVEEEPIVDEEETSTAPVKRSGGRKSRKQSMSSSALDEVADILNGLED